MAAGPTPMAALDRQQQRREAGLPTISVLRGAAGRAERTGRRWAESRGRAVAAVDDPRLEAMIDAWVDALDAGRDLGRDAVDWLARRLDRSAAELGPWIGRKTPIEREEFLESALPDESGTGVEAACRWLLARPAAGRPAATGLAAQLGDTLAERVVTALHALVPPGRAPVLLAVPPAPERTAWIESAATSLARLVAAEPRLTVLLASDPEALDAYQRLAPESRARALIRAGTIPVPALDGAEIGRRLDDALPLPCPAATRAGADPGRDDPARSAAERFLFERLAMLPETAGLFELNARLDFPFGPARAIEVDLAARALGLAVEIDGYHHFRDADAYRRDRRKDVVLQEHGFLVVRVLAEDVVGRLEAVLDQILTAVASRSRGTTP